jgi:ribose transport system substrate-binding protein
MCLAAAVALSVYSGSGSGAGGSRSHHLEATKLHVAALLAGTRSSWDTALKDGLVQQAKANGVDVTVFDAGYDPNKQFSQLQTAIASGKYNAYTLDALAPAQVCKTLQQLGGKGDAVIAMGEALCAAGSKPFKQQALPGITAFVGGSNSRDVLDPWAKSIVDQNPGQQKILLLTGPKGASISNTLESAMKKAIGERGNEVKLLVVDTDFSRAAGLTKTQTLLQSNPDISVVVGPVEGVLGAADAFKQAGRKSARLYVYGGDKIALGLLRQGKLAMISMDRPLTIGKETADLFAKIQNGKTVPSLVFVPDLQPGKPPAPELTKANAGGYQAEY